MKILNTLLLATSLLTIGWIAFSSDVAQPTPRPCTATNLSAIADSIAYVPPSRGIPNRREGGGTR